MPKTLNFDLGLDEDLREKLKWLDPDHGEFRILKQSVDARRSRPPHFVMSVEVAGSGESLMDQDTTPEKKIRTPHEKPIVIGTGPAGLFAALRLAERGLPCVIVERGSRAEERIRGINRFWRYGELDPNNNVCFGEGGAGLYSDGKLITRIKSPYIPYVLQKLVEFGAPPEIRYQSNPHVGSDKIRRLIPRLRERLKFLGCEFFFESTLTQFLLERDQIVGIEVNHKTQIRSPFVVLATGHSAQDVYELCRHQGVSLEGKSFAMGLRIEHPQAKINRIQYREQHLHPKLGSANYRLADHNHQTGIGVYSFCMCPGGYVLSSGTEADGVVCNGMSNFRRNSPFANSAIVVSIDHHKNFGTDTWGGLKLRRQLEKAAYREVLAAGGHKELPAQGVLDFLSQRPSKNLATSSPSGVKAVRLDQILPKEMTDSLQKSLQKFNDHLEGFIDRDAVFHGVESRTSSPLRIPRDPVTLQSISHRGLYPCGEGAGYAGGITSAACDGARIAEQIVSEITSAELRLPEAFQEPDETSTRRQPQK